MAERALVTGGAGFIGCHLARQLADDGYEVTIVDNLSRTGRDQALQDLPPGVTVHDHDLTTPIDDERLERSGAFDEVYHLAAMVGVRRTLEQPADVLRTNILCTFNLLDWCRRYPPRSLFLSSTSEVADGAVATGLAPRPVPEDIPFVLREPVSARSGYALSKVVSEFALHHVDAGTNVRIGRYFNVYGPRMGSAHVVPELIRRLVDDVDPFPLYGADQTRAFCYVSDAVAATLKLMRVPGPQPVVANIGNDREEVTVLALAQRLFALYGRTPRVDPVPAPSGSPARRCPDMSRLRELTGFEPLVDLSTGLAHTLAWYRHAFAADLAHS